MENFNLVTVTIQPDIAKKLFQSSVNASLKKTNGKNSSFSSSKSPEAGLGVKFLSAGLAACIADLVTYPLDTAKVRLQMALLQEILSVCVQIQGEGAVATASTGGRTLAYAHSIPTSNLSQQPLKYRGIVGTIRTLTKEEGVRALYNGLCPGLQRQMCFASVRIGLYDSVKHFYIRIFQANGVSGQNVGLRVLAGVTTGAMAVGCAQPTDVVKVRMQAQPKNARLYSGTINAYNTIAAKEGVRGLWKGTLPNVARNAIVNTTELVSYDLIKEAILRRKLLSDSVPCHFLAAFGAGFCTTVLASPVDVVKTRFMNAADGRYRGALHCASVMYKEGGLRAFYKGFMPSFVRLGSWNIVMFVSYEQLKIFLTKVNSNRKDKTNHQELQSSKKRESKPFELPSGTQRYM